MEYLLDEFFKIEANLELILDPPTNAQSGVANADAEGGAKYIYAHTCRT
jgi:hypothetical protein